MIFVYPLGVPLYYALILFRNKGELATIRQLELSITNEVHASSFTPRPHPHPGPLCPPEELLLASTF